MRKVQINNNQKRDIMTKILYIEVSPNGEKSASRKVGTSVIETLKSKVPGSTVVVRDLNANPVPHVTGELVVAANTPQDKRTPEQNETIKLSDELVDELLAADTIVIATPMWNFSVPSVLKAWIDHIVRTGRTFAYTEQGPKGLIQGKKLVVVVSTGGIYSEGPASAFDFLAPYLKSSFAFLGITESTIIRAEGVNDPRFSATAVEKAIGEVKKILA